MLKFLIWLVSLKGAICGCGADVRQNDFSRGKKIFRLEEKGQLPAVINESSGLIRYDSLWLSQNDSGGKNEVYAVNDFFQLKKTYHIDNQQNKDWEALAFDQKETLFIGDIGNNCNCRKDLNVIRYNLKTEKTEGIISFSYPDQTDFPPSKRNRHFDCEAMLFHQDSLYFFSKNRGKKMVCLYVIPAISGHHIAVLKDKIKINTAVTDAAISEDRTSFALLTYGKTLTFGIDNQQLNFQKPQFCIKSNRKLSEGIAFKNKAIWFTNEDGKVYEIEKVGK
jgi:hypothetical protein